MASYVIVGAGNGLGYQYLKTLAKEPSTTVIGIAQSPSTVHARLAEDAASYVPVLPGTLPNRPSITEAATQIADLVQDGIDYLIINGAELGSSRPQCPEASSTAQPGAQGDEDACSTVAGIMHAVETFVPLVKRSKSRKVVIIATQLAVTNNMLVTKYWLEYEADGIVFLALSPGLLVAAAGDPNSMPREQSAALESVGENFILHETRSIEMLLEQTGAKVQLEAIAQATMNESGTYVFCEGEKPWLGEVKAGLGKGRGKELKIIEERFG